MITTLKVLSLLLDYPTRELCNEVGDLRAALDGEGLLTGRPREALEPLFTALEMRDIYDLQEDYVFLFDRTKSLSLHLFEHVHGEGRDRGQAMVDLKKMYEDEGLDFAAAELPDFVPAFLEFLSTLEWERARAHLGEPQHIFAALRKRLIERETPYAAIFAALEALAGAEVSPEAVAALLQEPTENPDDLEALDKAWEDAAVEFGAGAALQDGCPAANDMLNRMDALTGTREQNNG
jgi:nitrate reductase delta subunit